MKCPACGSRWLYGPVYDVGRDVWWRGCKHCGAALHGFPPTIEEAQEMPCGRCGLWPRAEGDHFCAACRAAANAVTRGEDSHGTVW